MPTPPKNAEAEAAVSAAQAEVAAARADTMKVRAQLASEKLRVARAEAGSSGGNGSDDVPTTLPTWQDAWSLPCRNQTSHLRESLTLMIV